MIPFDDRKADQVTHAEKPKALSDYFEAIIGAVYVDSNFSIDAPWKV